MDLQTLEQTLPPVNGEKKLAVKEKVSGLWLWVKDHLSKWKEKAYSGHPEEVIREIATPQPSEAIPEPPAVPKIDDFEKGVFEKETSRNTIPSFPWEQTLDKILAETGSFRTDSPDFQWSNLESSMRGEIILRHYLQPIINFAQTKAPEAWQHIQTFSSGFSPDTNGDLANIVEGSSIIRLNPDLLRADSLSQDPKRLASALARIDHEARHIELNQYALDKKPLPQDMNLLIASTSKSGYMEREQMCWTKEAELYQKLTGEFPPITWDDVRERYSRKYD